MATPTGHPRRADAERSIAAILDAGLRRFVARPESSMTDIARAAGVSRVTLYAHFPSREALFTAVVEREVARAVATMAAQDGPPRSAREELIQMVRSAWQTLDRIRGLRAAAHLLPEARLREQHDPVLDRVRDLVERGQQEGDFRADLPRDWLVTVVYNLQHAAADEVNAGRLDPRDAAEVLVTTLLGALTPAPDLA